MRGVEQHWLAGWAGVASWPGPHRRREPIFADDEPVTRVVWTLLLRCITGAIASPITHRAALLALAVYISRHGVPHLLEVTGAHTYAPRRTRLPAMPLPHHITAHRHGPTPPHAFAPPPHTACRHLPHYPPPAAASLLPTASPRLSHLAYLPFTYAYKHRTITPQRIPERASRRAALPCHAPSLPRMRHTQNAYALSEACLLRAGSRGLERHCRWGRTNLPTTTI